MIRSLEQWQANLEAVATGLQAQCSGAVASQMYHLEVRPCPQHGPGCALVVYGAVLRHILWRHTDPEKLAVALLPDPTSLDPGSTDS